MNQFKVGQIVVHLSHGVGVIKGVEKREFSPNNVAEFFILEINDGGVPKKVFVPTEVAKTKIRVLSTDKELDKLFEILKTKIVVDGSQPWNRRYREYMDKIASGDLLATGEVVKALVQLQIEKDLSFGERKLLEQAKALLTKEISAAMNISESKAVAEIDMYLTGEV